jgi:hypothetical protein
MSIKTDIELRNFFIFNSLYGPKEGEELQKILYYYPITDHADVQIKNVGLVEGIIQFTGTFKPNTPVNSLHTQKMRQIYFQPEKNFWIVMVNYKICQITILIFTFIDFESTFCCKG